MYVNQENKDIFQSLYISHLLDLDISALAWSIHIHTWPNIRLFKLSGIFSATSYHPKMDCNVFSYISQPLDWPWTLVSSFYNLWMEVEKVHMFWWEFISCCQKNFQVNNSSVGKYFNVYENQWPMQIRFPRGSPAPLWLTMLLLWQQQGWREGRSQHLGNIHILSSFNEFSKLCCGSSVSTTTF